MPRRHRRIAWASTRPSEPAIVRVVDARALETDLYQLTMAAGYFHRGMREVTATCELFVRRLPKTRRYLVAMGVDAALDWLAALRFSEEDVEFLRQLPALSDAMSPAFCDYLRGLRFTGDVWAVEEGTVVFENEPLLRVRAPIIEAQLAETFLLSTINHATMIGTKAARVVHAAAPAACVEFGSRRTHPAAAVDAARWACAAGFAGTSNVEAGRRHGLTVLGTAAHMWTMAHPSEEQAFANYVATFPSASILLIDTYDTERGALRAARAGGDKLKGVRIDSGDIDALSRRVRKVLDDAGATGAKIVASGDLNEHSIAALRAAGAPVDTFGVGTEVVASVDAPALSGVYKVVELEEGGKRRPIAKFSEGKATFPGAHQVQRVSRDGRFARDVVALCDEPAALEAGETAEPLLSPALAAGARARPASPLETVRQRVAAQQRALAPWLLELAEVTRGSPRYEVKPSAGVSALAEQVRAQVVDG